METRADFAARFQAALEAELDRLRQDILAISDDACLQQVYDHVRTLGAGKAKRIRPYVASLLYRDRSGQSDDRAIMPALVAIEIFHLFALVHDDIMDNADERYGLPTVHALIRQAEGNRLGDETADVLGRAHAILAGDALLTVVHDLFLRLAASEPNLPVPAAHALLVRVSREIVAGQHLDIAFTVRPESSAEEILGRHRLKTALYTFARPMQIGAVLGGAGGDVLAFCEELGEALGIGFQMEDDLLDLLGDEQETGKAPCMDLAQRQHTLLTQYVVEHGSEKQQGQLRSLWGKHPFTPKDVAAARTLLEESGAVTAARARAIEAFDAASAILAHGPLQAETAAPLQELVAFLRARLP